MLKLIVHLVFTVYFHISKQKYKKVYGIYGFTALGLKYISIAVLGLENIRNPETNISVSHINL